MTTSTRSTTTRPASSLTNNPADSDESSVWGGTSLQVRAALVSLLFSAAIGNIFPLIGAVVVVVAIAIHTNGDTAPAEVATGE